MTVVLPAPVASLRASLCNSGLASWLAFAKWSRNPLPVRPVCGATSVSQITVSAASTWQKKGLMPLKRWWRQCCSSRAVSGVTCHWFGFGMLRHRSICWRKLSMTAGVFILLLLGGDVFPLTEQQVGLIRGRTLPLLWFRDGRNELRRPSAFNDRLSRLARVVQFPMPTRVLVGRVQDGLLKERIRHRGSRPIRPWIEGSFLCQRQVVKLETTQAAAPGVRRRAREIALPHLLPRFHDLFDHGLDVRFVPRTGTGCRT